MGFFARFKKKSIPKWLITTAIFLSMIGVILIGSAAWEGRLQYKQDKYMWELCQDPERRKEFERLDRKIAQEFEAEYGIKSDSEVCKDRKQPQFSLRFDLVEFYDPYEDDVY